jgi:hypothetical protein
MLQVHVAGQDVVGQDADVAGHDVAGQDAREQFVQSITGKGMQRVYCKVGQNHI